jgi:hypothetical protein
MMEASHRFGLPLLVPGQGQKDVTHNEAILAVDLLMHLTFEALELAETPLDPQPGQVWWVPEGATGDWHSRPFTIAAWTEGGWRHFAPREGISAFDRSRGQVVRYVGGEWVAASPLAAPPASVASPSGGGTVDAQARFAIDMLIGRLRELGLLT